MNEQRSLVVIPHYNHSAAIGAVVEQILALDFPVLVVDDGSSSEHLAALKNLEKQAKEQGKNLQFFYCEQNGGKGAAVKIGFAQAAQRGFSHAIQVDADGQHQLQDILLMEKLSLQNPQAIICGNPVYGEDAPKARLYGRKITDFWNIIHTWSLDIKDGMCGFRLYPLASILPLIKQEKLGDRMDFDTEILIKAHWHQIPLIWFDTPVKYASDGVSHFRVWRDNLMISKMHMFLFFGMLKRLLTGQPR